ICRHHGRTFGGRCGERWRRLHSHSRTLHRHLRAETNARQNPSDWTLPCLARTFCADRCGRPHGPDGSGPQTAFEVMAGYDGGDPSSAPLISRKLRAAETRKIRVGWFDENGCAPVTSETRAAV